MPFEKFTEFLDKRTLKEELNAAANQIDKRRQIFNNWMDAKHLNSEQVEEMLKTAGYKDIPSFIADPDDRKYAKLKIPGQENYR
jgi:hypothetical protein